ncbi:thermonuclease family protein [Helicobacter sp. T3_23-1056]
MKYILKKPLFAIVFVVIVFVLAFYEETTPPQEMQGKILKVYDGDTITILSNNNEQLRIRLFGLDAPESKQNFGNISTQNLQALCPVDSLANIKIKDKDKYGRIVAIVFCNGVNANVNQVKNGFAWAYAEYSYRYIPLEMLARIQKKGLWSEPNPVKPSDFRKK